MHVTVSRPDTLLPVDVTGEFRLDGPSSSRAILSAHGSLLRLAVPDWADLHGLGPRSIRAQRRALVTATGVLKRMSLTLDVNVDGQRIFGLGEGVRTTLLARLVGLTSADLRISNVVELIRSRAAARSVWNQ